MTGSAASAEIGRNHRMALALLAVHAFFLFILLTVVEASKGLSDDLRTLSELGITAMLGLGMVLFFIYSKWISPAKGNAVIQVVNVALGTTLFALSFPDQSLVLLQWLGVALCCVGITLLVWTGDSGFFLHPSADAAVDGAAGAPGAEDRRGGSGGALTWLLVGVALAIALWVFTVDWSGFDGSFASFEAALARRENALSLMAFEVAATTLVPLAAKIAVAQRLPIRIALSAGAIALLGIGLYFFFSYSDHLSVPKSNAILQTVNTAVGTLLVALLFADERLNLRQWLGVALCCVGVALTLELYDGDLILFRPEP